MDGVVSQVIAPSRSYRALLCSLPLLILSLGVPELPQILEQHVLSAAKAVEDKLDEQIAALERLDPDDIEALRERRMLQMRRAAERRAKWRALGHGEYTEVPEKEFFSAAKASERLVCHFYRDNWPCKVRALPWHPSFLFVSSR
jgi:hypothetical protein